MRRFSALAALSLYTVGVGAFAETCNTPAGWADVKQLTKTHIIALGEMHGTAEVPAFVSALLCDLVESDIPVRFGIEAARDQSEDLNRLVQNSFSDAEIYAAAPKMWDVPDGVSSKAVLSLLHQISEWRTQGADIGVFAFDFAPGSFPEDLDKGRHASMANSVDAATSGFDGAIVLVAGGAHTIISRQTTEPTSGSLANLISSRPVISLDMDHAGGTAFVTYSLDGSELTTGELSLSPTNSEELSDWSLEIEPFGVHYRGVFSVGAITASPPAFAAED